MGRLSDMQLLGAVFVPLVVGAWIAMAFAIGRLFPCAYGAACYLPVLAALLAFPVAGVASFALVRLMRPDAEGPRARRRPKSLQREPGAADPAKPED